MEADRDPSREARGAGPASAGERSALAAVYRPGRVGVADGPAAVTIRERTGRLLVQVSGWPGSFGAVCASLENVLAMPTPRDGRTAVSKGSVTLFRVSPERVWIAAAVGLPALVDLRSRLGRDAVVTQIDHGRVVLRVGGSGAAVALNRGLPVDLDPAVFPDGAFAQSVIHGISVLVHRVGAADPGAAFDVYVPRDYAVSFWEWLTGVAQTLGCDVEPVR